MPTTRNLGHRAQLAAVATLGLTLLTACSSDNDAKAERPAATTPVTSTAPVADASATPSADGAARTVTVSETEFTIDMASMTFSAGTYTFAVHNVGKFPHALSFDGPGVEDVATGQVAPGSTGSVTVTFVPGSYAVYCPVSDHKSRGMDMKITVT